MRDKLSDAELELIGRTGSDESHIAKAREHINDAIRELVACRRLEWPIVRALHLVNEVEDTLWQYVQK